MTIHRSNFRQSAKASGKARVTQIAGDQHIHNYGKDNGPAHLSPAPLPSAPAHLIGRDEKISEILAVLDPRGTNQGAGAGVVVSGLPGVGKTALALHAAHAAKAEGRFTGGILAVELHGYDPTACLSAGQALIVMLRQLGIRDEDLPPAAEEQTGLYQSQLDRLAEMGKSVLLVVDDASSTAQVLPLIPARSEHRILITSRDVLAGLPVRQIALAELAPAAAADLVAETLLNARTEESRPGREAEELNRLVGYCGHLPLALQIVAAILTAAPGLSVKALADKLESTRERLAALHYDDPGFSIAVAAAFDLSYQRLTAEQSRVFTLLPFAPGPDLSTEAATALIGCPAREILDSLARTSLIAEQPVGAGRWRMHDLVRLYAANAEEDSAQRTQALDQLFEHYRSAADDADSHLQALPGELSPERFDSHRSAERWMDAERHNLVDSVTSASASGRHSTAISLAGSLAYFLNQRRHFDDAITTSRQALASAVKIGDRPSQSRALSDLGQALYQSRQFDEAIDVTNRAAAISRKLKDRQAEGHALTSLGNALLGVRRFEEAISNYTRAAALLRTSGDSRNEGGALNSLGTALREARRFEEAIDACNRAAAAFRSAGEQRGEGLALINLGTALRATRRLEEAVDISTRAVAAFDELGDRHGQAQALAGLGLALFEVRQLKSAIDAHTQAAAMLAELNDQHGEAMELGNLAVVLLDERRFDEAMDACGRASGIFRELNDRHGEGQVLVNLGAALRESERFDEAIEVLTRSATALRKAGDQYREAQALGNLGAALRQAGRLEEAIETHTLAVATFVAVNDQRGESLELNNLGAAFLESRQFEEAIEVFTRAAALAVEPTDAHAEAAALNNLGLAFADTGRFDEAVDAHTRAANIFHALGDRYNEDLASTNLELALRRARKHRKTRRFGRHR